MINIRSQDRSTVWGHSAAHLLLRFTTRLMPRAGLFIWYIEAVSSGSHAAQPIQPFLPYPNSICTLVSGFDEGQGLHRETSLLALRHASAPQ